MKKVLTITFIFSCLMAHAQWENDLDYLNEWTWGVNKNTNSGLIGGFTFKWGRQFEEGRFHTFGLELINVSHPKEQRYFAQASGTNFIWGKENFLYSFRFQYGQEKVLYKKAPQKGVQISALFAGGPTWALVSPYYVLGTNGRYSKYSVDEFPNRTAIGGSGKILQGLGESKSEFGFNLKTGLSFEFGNFKTSVVGVETGVSSEVFTREIPIMAVANNKAMFNQLYFTIYWGKRR